MGRGPASSLAKGTINAVQAVPVSCPAPPPHWAHWLLKTTVLRRHGAPDRAATSGRQGCPTSQRVLRVRVAHPREAADISDDDRGPKAREFVRRLLNALRFSALPVNAQVLRRTAWGRDGRVWIYTQRDARPANLLRRRLFRWMAGRINACLRVPLYALQSGGLPNLRIVDTLDKGGPRSLRRAIR
jgi:hypothetical protein